MSKADPQTTDCIPGHPMVIDSGTKLCRLATQDDIHAFERVAMKYDHLLRTLKELIDV